MSTIEKKSVKVGKYVDNAHVDTAIRTYKQERWKYNTERLGKADSLSAWYSVEELEEYIEFIKEHGADGIRFYFGAYPENYEERPEYAGRQTIVLVATKNTNNGDKKSNKDLYIGNGQGARVLAYNTPDLCPPYCSGGGTPPPKKAAAATADLKLPELGVTIIDQGEKGMVII